MRILIVGLIAVALLGLTERAEATRQVRVYEATVSSQTDTAVQAQSALRLVLVRATGARDAANDPALAGVLANASQYVLGTRPAGAGSNTLVVMFDGAALERSPLFFAAALPLRTAGFAPSQPSVWLLEGVLFYLEEHTVQQVLGQVSALAAPGSGMGFDVMNRAMLTSPWRREWQEQMRRLGAPQRSAMDEPEVVLDPLGWQVQVTQPGEDGANFGRWPYPVIPRAQPDIPRSFLVTAQREDR